MKFIIPTAVLAGSVAAQISNGDHQTLPIEPTALQDTPSSTPSLEWATLTGGPVDTPSLPLSSLPSDVTIITGTREPSDSHSMDTTMMPTTMQTTDMPGSPTAGPSSSAAGGGDDGDDGDMTSSPPSTIPSDAAGAVPTANAVAGLAALAGFAMAL